MSTLLAFTVADDAHYLGLVALITSLRMHNEPERITVLDIGLSPWQRDELAASCCVVHLEEARGRHPWFLAAYPALLNPDGVVLYVDADVVVTGSFAPLIAAAERGKVCAGADWLGDRWHAEWEPTFDLTGPPRHQPYCNAGAVLFSTRHHPDLLRRWWECCSRIVTDISDPRVEPPDPIRLADQDALNALLMTEVAAEELVLVPSGTFAHGPQMDSVVVRNAARLECTADGRPTLLLHAFGSPKPWQRAAARDLRPTPYLRCLQVLTARALDPDAAPPHVDPRTVPAWLRPTVAGRITRGGLFTRSWVRRHWCRLQNGVQRRVRSRASRGEAR